MVPDQEHLLNDLANERLLCAGIDRNELDEAARVAFKILRSHQLAGWRFETPPALREPGDDLGLMADQLLEVAFLLTYEAIPLVHEDGAPPDALALRRVEEIRATAPYDDLLEMVRVLSLLGRILEEAGADALAWQHQFCALQLLRRDHVRPDPAYIKVLAAVGLEAGRLQEPTQMRTALARAWALARRHQRDDAELQAWVLAAWGEALELLGEPGEAKGKYRRALSVLFFAGKEDSPSAAAIRRDYDRLRGVTPVEESP